MLCYNCYFMYLCIKHYFQGSFLLTSYKFSDPDVKYLWTLSPCQPNISDYILPEAWLAKPKTALKQVQSLSCTQAYTHHPQTPPTLSCWLRC